MAARQLWAFLTDADLQHLIAQMNARDPGVVATWGRYLRGDPQALASAPETLPRREALPKERRLYLTHRRFSTDLVAHLQPEGPFAGWSQIDEERTDCLVLRVPTEEPGFLGPSRIYAHIVNWRGTEKQRKKPLFSVWAGQTLKWMLAELPVSGTPFIRIGPDALQQARTGRLTLRYLLRPLPAEPIAAAQAGAVAPADALTRPEELDEE